jgi:TRAP-type C4-dicarboxylate transport system permease small subunit
MQKVLNSVIRLSGILAAALLLVMVAVMALSIVMRQFGGLLMGSEDIATFSMVGLAFLGLPSVYRAGLHIRVETVLSRLPKPAQKWLNIGSVVVAILVCLVLIYFSASLLADSWRFGDTSYGLLAIPLWIPQLPIPLGLGLLVLALLDDLLRMLRNLPASFQTVSETGDASHSE